MLAISRDDLAGLADALNGIGVPPAEVDSLRGTIEKSTEDQRPRVCAEWYKRMKQAVASGAWSLAQGATTSTIRTALLSYLGLGQS